MTIYRCDFKVISDVVLDDTNSEIMAEFVEGYTLKIKNGELDVNGNIDGLNVSVIGPADSLDRAENQLSILLAEQLDLLAIATQSRFKIIESQRVIEWEEGLKERHIKYFQRFNSKYPPEKCDLQKYIDTVVKFNRVDMPPFVKVALKYFRLGLLEVTSEDQFMRFWLALEIVAENVKQKEKISFQCELCDGALQCSECGHEPRRVPMAKQAIEALIRKITGDMGEQVIRRQFIARNGLMHGRSKFSIEKQLGIELHRVTEELGQIVWSTIFNLYYEKTEGQLKLVRRLDGFSHIMLVAVGTAKFVYEGGGAHPTENEIPNINIRMVEPKDGE